MMKAQKATGIDDDSFEGDDVDGEALEMAPQPGLEDSDDEVSKQEGNDQGDQDGSGGHRSPHR